MTHQLATTIPDLSIEDHELTVLVFCRGECCPFCEAHPRELDTTFRERVVATGCRLVGVISQSAETAQAAHESWRLHFDDVWAAIEAARTVAAPPETNGARLDPTFLEERYPEQHASSVTFAATVAEDIDARWASPSEPARAGLSHARRQPLTTRSVNNDFRRPNRHREFCPSQHPTTNSQEITA